MSSDPPDAVTAPIGPQLVGSWPEHCEQRAFVDGAAWLLWKTRGYTPWSSERDEYEAEAVRRYGEPDAKPDAVTAPASLVALVQEMVCHYDAYRGKGVIPAQDAYALMVQTIEKLRAWSAPAPPPCIGNDPSCPCQDGDSCHYVDTATTKAMPMPERPDPRTCVPGLYRVIWTNAGGESLAAVGVYHDGTRWLAPTNWVYPSRDPTVWDDVAALLPVAAPAPLPTPLVAKVLDALESDATLDMRRDAWNALRDAWSAPAPPETPTPPNVLLTEVDGRPVFWQHAIDECNAAHLALDRKGAPKTKWVPRLRGDITQKQEITIGLAERIFSIPTPAAPSPETPEATERTGWKCQSCGEYWRVWVWTMPDGTLWHDTSNGPKCGPVSWRQGKPAETPEPMPSEMIGGKIGGAVEALEAPQPPLTSGDRKDGLDRG